MYGWSKPHHEKLISRNRGNNWCFSGGGGTQLFSGRGVRPGFPKCGACKLTFASEKGGLWAENFQIWGLVSWKFPNLGACELKFGWKFRLLRLKFPNFLKRGSCELTLLFEMWPCERQERREKGVFRATHPHTPFLGQCPPGPGGFLSLFLDLFSCYNIFAAIGLPRNT